MVDPVSSGNNTEELTAQREAQRDTETKRTEETREAKDTEETTAEETREARDTGQGLNKSA